MFIPVGKTVRVMADPQLQGEVAGHFVDLDGNVMYVVFLERTSQFWSENRNVFVRHLVVHPTSLATF